MSIKPQEYQEQIIQEFLNTIKEFNLPLYNHSINTAEYAINLAKNLGMDIDLVRSAALVHDVGKLVINLDILNKPGPLNIVEREKIDLHSYFGYQILKSHDLDNILCEIVLFHHGTSKNRMGVVPNPDELVIKYADVLRCCDIYDALTSDRVYRKHMDKNKALSILEREDIPSEIIRKFQIIN